MKKILKQVDVQSVKQRADEQWEDIPGYVGLYQASTLGRVKSLDRVIVHSNGKEVNYKGKVLNPYVYKHYQMVNLSKNSKVKTITVHQVIAITFLGHKPNEYKIVIDHINNVKTDNRVSNLQLITHRKNCSKDRKSYSGYTGVYENGNKWRARIRIGGKMVNLGSYSCPLKASVAYNNKVKEMYEDT